MDNAGPRRRLMHTSDVHLGAYDFRASDEKRMAQFARFTRLIDLANVEQVEALLIAGDFFDNSRVRTETLQFANHELARLECPVVLLPGNHDHVGVGSVYDRDDFVAAANLLLFRDPNGETITLRDLDMDIWGRAHDDKRLDFEPFANPPAPSQAKWQLGIGHGHFLHPQSAPGHSYVIRESELASCGRHYVALGHWEQMTRVAAGPTAAAYSGAPDGILGRTPGYAMVVDLYEDGPVQLTALSLDNTPHLGHDEIPLLAGA